MKNQHRNKPTPQVSIPFLLQIYKTKQKIDQAKMGIGYTSRRDGNVIMYRLTPTNKGWFTSHAKATIFYI